MAHSYQDVEASDGQDTFGFSIPYLSRTHMTVLLDGVSVDFSFTTAQTILLDTPVSGTGHTVRILRTTPIDEAIVDFTNGSTLGEAELDASAAHSLYSAQEVFDDQENNLRLDVNLRFDADEHRIINLASSVAATDAVNRTDLEEEVATMAAELAVLHQSNFIGTATSADAFGTGSKAFTTEADKSFQAGSWVVIIPTSQPTWFMHGVVTAYSGTSLTVNVTNTSDTGSGVLTDFTIMVSGTRGPAGVQGLPGEGDLNAVNNLSDVDDEAAALINLGAVAVVDLTSDVATYDVSTSQHGLVPKASTVPEEFLNAESGLWTVPPLSIVQDNGSPLTARKNLNFIAGTGITITVADNAGSDSTDVTIELT